LRVKLKRIKTLTKEKKKKKRAKMKKKIHYKLGLKGEIKNHKLL
jgi:hypothetical protein